MAQLTVGPSSIACGNQFTGYYYDLNLGVFVKLITRPFSYIAHKTLQVSTTYCVMHFLVEFNFQLD